MGDADNLGKIPYSMNFCMGKWAYRIFFNSSPHNGVFLNET